MSQNGETLTPTLDAGIAEWLARIALGHVTREFPNKPDHVRAGPEDVRRPRALHPIFFGSFDWHSCVHGYWLLARIYRRYPLIAVSRQIGSLLDAQFTSDKVARELAYLDKPFARGFESAGICADGGGADELLAMSVKRCPRTSIASATNGKPQKAWAMTIFRIRHVHGLHLTPQSQATIAQYLVTSRG